MVRDPETIIYPKEERTIRCKGSIFMGPHTRVIHRYPGQHTLGFQIIFQPAALCQLIRVRAADLTNIYVSADQILGNRTEFVCERLYHAKNYQEMILIVEGFLCELLKSRKQISHPVDQISTAMLCQCESFALDKFLNASSLSHRQVDRKFKERIGMNPKQFLQMARFDRAFRMKNKFPHMDWLSISLYCGYYDYQHLSKEYKLFTNYTPKEFFAIDSRSPERMLGDAEI
jgi:AraC-like DNA-binding protein